MAVANRNVDVQEDVASVQQELFRSLLQTPHRQVDATLLLHREQMDRDPEFYARLAVYALNGGNDVRDINEAFVANLLNSEFPEIREVGYVLLQNLPPYQVARVSRQFTGWHEVVHQHSTDAPMPKNGENGVTYTRAKYSDKHADAEKRGKEIPRTAIALGKKSKLRERLLKAGKINYNDKQIFKETFHVTHEGLGNRRHKGMLKKAIDTYLRLREADSRRSQMEGALIRAKDDMRRLYAKNNRLAQNDENGWINQWLFKNKAEEGSRLAALQQLSRENDPTRQAEIIFDNKLPFTSVVSLVKNFTPAVWVALINAMSPQELLQSLNQMKRHGVYDNADLKAQIEAKLKKAKTSKGGRMDALKAEKAAKEANISEELRQELVDISDTQLSQKGEIKARTAILIDKSASMSRAIEIGKVIASTLSQACLEIPEVYLFDYGSNRIVWNDRDGDPKKKSSWDNKLKMVKANGGTCPNKVISDMIRANRSVEQIVLITDEGENERGRFARDLKQYEDHFGFRPNIVIVRVPSSWGADDRMEKSLKNNFFDVDVLEISEASERAMSAALPNLIRMLSRKSVFDFVQEIREIELPTKAGWDAQNNVADLPK